MSYYRSTLNIATATCLLVALSLTNISGKNISISVLYVIQDHLPTSECPTQHCITLSVLAEMNNTNDYISSNTRVLFLPGNHTVEQNGSLMIQDVNNLQVSGKLSHAGIGIQVTGKGKNEAAAKVVCTSTTSFGVTLRNVTNLTISNIAWISCGARPNDYNTEEMPSDLWLGYMLGVLHSSNVTIHGVTIAHSKGFGMWLHNVYSSLTVSNSFFTSNHGINSYITVNTGEVNYENREKDQYNGTIRISNSTFAYGNILGNSYISASGIKVNIENTANITFEIVYITLLDNCSEHRHLHLVFLNSEVETKIFGLNATSGVGTNGTVYLVGAKNFLLKGALSITDSYFKGTSLVVGRNIADIVLLNNTVVDGGHNPSIDINVNAVLQNVRISNSRGHMAVLQSSATVKIQGICTFQHNKGAFVLEPYAELTFGVNSTAQFLHNNVKCTGEYTYCSTLSYVYEGRIKVQRSAHVVFRNNTAQQSGGISLLGYLVLLENSSILFEDNSGSNGGAMEINDGSIKSLFTDSEYIPTITFIRNRASRKGGAIFETSLLQSSVCETHAQILFTFVNNTAILGGSAVYGAIESVVDANQSPLAGCDPEYIDIEGDSNDHSLVTSDPIRVCICNCSVPNCNVTDYTAEIYPGQELEIEVVAVGLRFGTVTATIRAEYNRNEYSWRMIGGGQYLQHASKYCTVLRYETLINSYQMKSLTLTPNVSDANKRFTDRLLASGVKFLEHYLVINFEIKNCSLGFRYTDDTKKCACQKTLTNNGLHCNMTSLNEVYRLVPTWINATFEHNIPDTEHGVIVHDYCPYDYCRSDTMELPLNLENPEHQCAFNRSGTLCGACQTNLSHVFGTSKCKHCSSLWVLLYIPLLALAGFALVQFLTLLDLTVSIGTINGLIFYANVVRANQAIFFSPQTTNSFFSIFIAWLNLDIAIETCFYGGLDAYVKTWLQFVFPLYIWLIVIIIIVLSRHYTAIARISGTNAVQVLATLFLLSYAKLLRIIVTVFQPTTLVYPDGYHRRVWLYDGNVDYLKGKHIPLFIAALLLLTLLSIPYTTILLTIQWLQKRNQYRVLFWVRKLKPLFDAYTGPYKENHRYWTGLLLLIRVLLFLIFSLNIANNPSVNLLAINTAIFLILTHLSLVGGVYESRLANVIEVSFLLNVGLLSAATFYQVNTSGNQKQITYTSTGLAFVSFVAIVIYHISKRLLETRRGSKFKRIVESKLKENIVDRVTEIAIPSPVAPQVTHSSIELREALLVS